MGWYFPWRKTLTVLLIITSFTIFPEPISGKRHIPSWKSDTITLGSSFIESRNSYKNFDMTTLEVNNLEAVDSYLNSKTLKEWSNYLNITYKRLLPYRDFIAKEIYEQNVPLEILFLPIIESAAYPMAVSQRGATGMWQFMANSSGAYDMQTTEWMDERRDFVKSTRGAIAKLKYNYKVTGDWLLAIAAYNCGLNRIKTVVKTSGINDYWELSKKGLLPKETIKYIPKLIGVSRLFQNKKSFNISLKWDKTQWDEIELSQAIDLRLLSYRAEIPLKILQAGNKELNYDVTPPAYNNYKLKVPTEYSDKVVKALEDENKLMEFYRYKVKSGDTLSEIGYYYGLSTTSLIRYNPGVSPRTLRVGKTLIVPALKKVDPYGNNRKIIPFKNNYVVKDGDTLWDIAMEYGTTVEEIALNSGLGVNNYIKKGMKLKVP